jgi:hypothetical protein
MTMVHASRAHSAGRRALNEAQMSPDDYNGILAGDPANNWVNLNVDQVYEVQVNEADPASGLCADQPGRARSIWRHNGVCRSMPQFRAASARV